MKLLFEGQISIKAILENQKREVYELFLEKGKRSKDIGYILHLAHKRDLPISYLTKEEIQQMAQTHTHGGILLKAGTQKKEKLPTSGLHGYLCMIDGVEDPYNLGSIVRTLYASGCKALILPDRDWDHAQSTILKASAGALERLPIYWIDSEQTLVDHLHQMQIPLVIAHRKDAISLYDYTFPETFCLAIGGALRGLKAPLVKQADQNLVLEYGRDFRYALDTASACSAFSFEIVRQRRNINENK